MARKLHYITKKVNSVTTSSYPGTVLQWYNPQEYIPLLDRLPLLFTKRYKNDPKSQQFDSWYWGSNKYNWVQHMLDNNQHHTLIPFHD
eukprot:2055149-Rhodomonas_salina.1